MLREKKKGGECWNQERDERREVDEDGYPNEEAPSEAEMIGALNRISFRIKISLCIVKVVY